jgi:anti-sigma factor RsiW
MTGEKSVIPPEDLLSYVDDRLEPNRAAEVERWLLDHPEESRKVEEWRRQTSLLKSALDPIAREPVPADLAHALRQRRRPWVRVAMAAAIAGILAFPAGLAVGWSIWRGSTGSGLESLAEAGLSAHRIYAVEVRHPVEVGADEQQHLVQWLSKRVGVSITAPDLSEAGLRLLGGRLVPANGKPGALLMYEGQSGVRFTLLIEQVSPPRMTAFRYAERDELGAFYWADGQIGCVLAGPGERTALQRVAESAYEQLE